MTRQLIDYEHEPWNVFMVYGSFTEPEKGTNFIVVRHRAGRVPWAKKIAPAIARLVHPWFPAEARTRYDRFWNVDGESAQFVGDHRLWDTTTAIRFEWDGEQLVRAP